jgi:ribonuclease D
MKLITTTHELEALCKELKKEKYITVDTEFLREKTYYPKLCLIQIASENHEFAVDPLADGIDLSKLFKIFANKKVLKVFHSAKQDIEIIYNMSGVIPKPLFDTQVAAMVCGFGPSASYALLVSDLVGQSVDKSSRFTDWSKRPLTENQLSYAISDVTHLRDVYKSLKESLDEDNRSSWVEEEMASLLDKKTYDVDPDTVWEKMKHRGSSRRFLGVLKELAKWRELHARHVDKPRGHVIKDPALLEIAAVQPETSEQLRSIRGVGSFKAEIEKAILDAVKTGKNMPERKLPEKKKHKKPLKNNEALVEMLKVLLKAKCAEFNVAEKLVATADELKEIVSSEKLTKKLAKGWRFEVFGQHVLSLMKNEIALSVKSGKMEIVSIK